MEEIAVKETLTPSDWKTLIEGSGRDKTRIARELGVSHTLIGYYLLGQRKAKPWLIQKALPYFRQLASEQKQKTDAALSLLGASE